MRPILGHSQRISSGKPPGDEIDRERGSVDPGVAQCRKRGGGIALGKPLAISTADERVVTIEWGRQAEHGLK